MTNISTADVRCKNNNRLGSMHTSNTRRSVWLKKTVTSLVPRETEEEDFMMTIAPPPRTIMNASVVNMTGKPPSATTPSSSQHQQKPKKCTRCGKVPAHGRLQCPAKDVNCHGCGKKGHYKSMCHTAAPGTAPAATDLSSVSYAPLNLRPTYKPGEEDEPDDIKIRIGPPLSVRNTDFQRVVGFLRQLTNNRTDLFLFM